MPIKWGAGALRSGVQDEECAWRRHLRVSRSQHGSGTERASGHCGEEYPCFHGVPYLRAFTSRREIATQITATDLGAD
jgi:hypothetical protein